MNQISPLQVKSAVLAFLSAQYEKKTESERKQLEKAKEAEDLVKISELETSLAAVRQKYSFEEWLQDAAERMAKQLKFGTHISKGIHPDAKGDNVNYQTDRTLPTGIVGSQSIQTALLDANGNAAALPLAAFFDTEISESGGKLRSLILQDSPALQCVFAEDKVRSEHYQSMFKAALLSDLSEPITHERNKQLLFPIASDNYRCIVPLYPSVLTHELYQRMIALRFSAENKTARENRFKKNVEQQSYLSIPNVAVTILGGTKPQNVSQLMSKQGGRNYLLPSLPPHFQQREQLRIGLKTESLFNKNLEYLCREPLKALFKIIKTDYKNKSIRDARENILDSIIYHILSAVAELQNNKPAGWTAESELNYNEQLWLDSGRAKLEGEIEFKLAREKGDWREAIPIRFANWINYLLQQEFKAIKDDFADPEHKEWRKEIEKTIQESLRQGKEVFA